MSNATNGTLNTPCLTAIPANAKPQTVADWVKKGTFSIEAASAWARQQVAVAGDRKDKVLELLGEGVLGVALAKTMLAELTSSPRPQGQLYCKVSSKGALSVYGLGQWPTTLYVESWVRLLEFAPQLQQFAKDNDTILNRKSDTAEATAIKSRSWPASKGPRAAK